MRIWLLVPAMIAASLFGACQQETENRGQRQPIPQPKEKLELSQEERRSARQARQEKIVENAISSSDDFDEYKDQFMKATGRLIKDGTCDSVELRNMGGWVRSQSHKPKPVYFTYCGGMKTQNRIYLNVGTERVFR